MLAIGLVLAIGVTIHILLRKREVASAVGWIGLVWFAPNLGAIAYSMFGVNRVRRRARRLRPRDSDSDDQPGPLPSAGDGGLNALGRGIGHITGRPLLAGTVVQAYENGDNAYPPMLAAIAAAKSSVGLSSYIFQDDRWGGRFIEALTEAKARGVQVRVLIDGIGGGWLRSPAYHQLCRHGVTAARFMHSSLPWRMPFVNLRTHKKILLVDGTIGFTGGMNIADDNVMATQPKMPVQDLHFRIEGPVVSQLAEAFAEDWAFAADEDLTGNAWSPEIVPNDGALARVIDSGPDEDLEKVEFAVLQALACARGDIEVMTPYFLPDERLVTALALAAMRGVAVDLVIPAESNHRLVDWAARANIGPLLDAGVRIWLSPAPFHHGKIMVVDREWCLIGSSNWDIRSFRLNFELCMEVYDHNLATTLTAIMRRARGPALTQAALDARPLPIRIRDAGARLMLPYL
ncbi:phospholipase D-like domain-containing protein [Acidisphaera sp. S103]|uniref:phospholipase D-like domain-containing protein n=1 Tax=Acidisphaera sp. S103 TaxID=1747223 RepID=UPI00131DAC79|nr:phospholipase D-like domain-containing protein [Acidisphaera sp. S103]